MASTAIQTQGTQFYISNGESTPAWVKIGNVKSVSGIDGGTSNDIDITNLDSTAKEYAQGLKDSGELSLTMDWNGEDAGQIECQQSFDGSLIRKFYIKIPLGGTDYSYASFNGTVKGFSKDGGVDAVWTSSVSIRISGSITWGTVVPTA